MKYSHTLHTSCILLDGDLLVILLVGSHVRTVCSGPLTIMLTLAVWSICDTLMPSYIAFNGHAVQLLLSLHEIVHFVKDFSSYYYICSQTVTGKLCVAVMDREPDELRGHRSSGFKALFAGEDVQVDCSRMKGMLCFTVVLLNCWKPHACLEGPGGSLARVVYM